MKAVSTDHTGINHDMTNFINAQSALSNVVENIETTGEDIYGQIPLGVKHLSSHNPIEQVLVGRLCTYDKANEKG